MYLAPACFVWLMAGVAVVEWPAMRDNHALQLILNKPLWYFAAAAMGFCVNLLAYMVIQTASSLTLKVPLPLPKLLIILRSTMRLSIQGCAFALPACAYSHSCAGYNIIHKSVAFQDKASSGHGQWPMRLAPDDTSCDAGKPLHVAVTASCENCVCLELSSVNVAGTYHDGCLKTSVIYACYATTNSAA